jgi:hypothetical protein
MKEEQERASGGVAYSLGRRSHCYRCDNIALAIIPPPMPPRLWLKSSLPSWQGASPMSIEPRGGKTAHFAHTMVQWPTP